MPHARVVATAFIGLILTSGCRDQNNSAPGSATGTGPVAGVRPSAQDLPPAVNTAFRREFPNAGITNVTQLSAETGAPLYRVTYINNRTPGAATYFHNGQRLNPTTQQQ
jgi:hypothetical protein